MDNNTYSWAGFLAYWLCFKHIILYIPLVPEKVFFAFKFIDI